MRIRKSTLFFSSLILCFGLSIALDRVVGLFWPALTAGLVFPPNAHHHFQIPEFSFAVDINSLGFRDREFSLQKTAKVRILAIGDSFTYGWGVEANQSWPKVLEEKLRASGHDVEIANLGKPGGYPAVYADIAERATPVLKPDLLIIAVLQGDDLAQMDETVSAPASAKDEVKKQTGPGLIRRSIQAVASVLYPHFLALVNERVKPQPAIISQWQADARNALAAMTPEDKSRYEKLDPAVKSEFINGHVNPSLISLSVTRPDYFLQTLDLNSAKTRLLIQGMAKQLARIKSTADQNHADVMVVSVPYGFYVSAKNLSSLQRLGFSVTPEALKSNAADEAIRSASQMAGIPFYDSTIGFRQISDHTDLFFDQDNHFNPTGHRYFAEALLPVTEKKLSSP
jgi:lysophospholipase L1-like esterase